MFRRAKIPSHSLADTDTAAQELTDSSEKFVSLAARLERRYQGQSGEEKTEKSTLQREDLIQPQMDLLSTQYEIEKAKTKPASKEKIAQLNKKVEHIREDLTQKATRVVESELNTKEKEEFEALSRQSAFLEQEAQTFIRPPKPKSFCSRFWSTFNCCQSSSKSNDYQKMPLGPRPK